MLKTIKNLVLYLISTIIVIAMFVLSYQVLSNTYINHEADYGESFHNLPENSMDVLVLGSSHAQYSFSPNFFYQDTGLYSYVLGTGGQPLEMSYEMLKEGLKTQSPKLVILEVYTALPLRDIAEADYNYISPGYQMTGEEKINAFNYLPDEKGKEFLNEYLVNHNNWKTEGFSFDIITQAAHKTYLDLKGEKEYDYEKISDSFGYICNYLELPPKNYWYPYNTHDYIDVELDDLDKKSLDNILNLCRNNDIELVLYKTPMDSLDQENISYLHKVWEWADSNNVKYIDFVEEAPKLGFYMWIHSDSFHSCINGASIITSELSNLINNNYSFNHVENDMLREKYKKEGNRQIEDYLNYEYNANFYLDRLKQYNGVVLIKYKKTENCGEAIKNYLDYYHINTNDDFIGLFKNGELVKSDVEKIYVEIDGHIVLTSGDYFEVDGNGYEDTGDLVSVIISNDYSSFKVKSTNINRQWQNSIDGYGC